MRDYNIALILSGGGFRSYFQVGVIQSLIDEGVLDTNPHFDIVSGNSAGALNGSFIASKKWTELNDIWDNVKENGRDVIFTSELINEAGTPTLDFSKVQQLLFPEFAIKIKFWDLLGMIFSEKSRNKFLDKQLTLLSDEVGHNLKDITALADNSPLYKILTSNLKLSDIPETTRFILGIVSLVDAKYYSPTNESFSDDYNYHKAILASTSMPVVWPPVQEISWKNNTIKSAVDGGIRNSSPIADVIKVIKADSDSTEWRFLVINNHPNQIPVKDIKYDLLDTALRSTLDITQSEIFLNDVNEFKKINKLVKKINELDPNTALEYKYFKNVIISPEGIDLGEALDTTTDVLKYRYNEGYKLAKSFVENGELKWE